MISTAPPAFPPADDAARAALLDWIAATPLVYGPWQGFKRLYKDAETAFINGTREPEILAALLARLDAQTLDVAQSDAALPGRFGALGAAQGFGYVWANGKTLETYDLSSPAQPQLVSRWELGESEGISPEITLHGALLWLNYGNRFWLFDLANRAAPALVGAFTSPYYINDIAGEHLACWDGERAVRVLEARDGNLVEIGICDFGGAEDQQIYVNDVLASPGLASASFYDYQSRNYMRQIVDLSDPTNPKLGERARGDYYANINVIGDIAYNQNDNDWQLWDISNPNALKKLGKIRLSGMRMLSYQTGRVAALCMEWGNGGYQTQIRLIDVSRPSAPRLIGQHDINEIGSPLSLALAGDTLYLSAGDGLHIFDISDPARAQEIGKSPSAQTFAYLKRRGRRFLRLLSQTDETAFCQVAAAFFAAIQTRTNINWDDNWIAADLVAANHPNWHQASHGRGAYLEKSEIFVLKGRVERGVAAWDAHPETLRPFIENSVTAPVVHLARQVCNAQTPLAPAQIESYVSSRWPNLRVTGARAARSSNIAELSPRAIAGALFASSRRARRELLDASAATPQVASELASFLGASAPLTRDKFGRRQRENALTRRAREVALLLAARFDLSDPAFRADGALPILRALLGAGEAPLRTLGAQFCRRLSGEQILPLLSFAADNSAVLDALLESASRADFDKKQIDKAIRATKPAMRAAAWRLIEASQTSSATLNAVWLGLLRGLTQQYDWNARTRSWQISDALKTAVGDANARACLVRGALDAREVRPRWSSDFMGVGGGYYSLTPLPGEFFAAYALFLPAATVVSTVATLPDALWENWKAPFAAAIAPHSEVTARFWRATQEYLDAKKPDADRLRARTFGDAALAATFAGAAGQLPPELLLSLIASVPAAVWQSWRASLLRVLQTDATRREAFWGAARLQGFESAQLRARLIEDAEFAATFGLLEDVLEFDDPALESLLLLWLGARELDGETAVLAATHPLPQVRAVGLQLLQTRGLNVPIALRLLESDLRDAMDAAKNWFDSRSENIAALALALCDSPRLRVREFGREWVAARLDALIGDGFLPKLEENPNAEMQAFVAKLLLEREVETQPVAFDRAVLRGRNRARHAKNLVQARRKTDAPLPDDATLLELARGKTPRDAEWAMQQLARRALESRVEGVEVGGIGAI